MAMTKEPKSGQHKLFLFILENGEKLCKMAFETSLNGHVGAYDTKQEKYLLMGQEPSSVPFSKAQYTNFVVQRQFFVNFAKRMKMPPQDKLIVPYDDADPKKCIQFARVSASQEKKMLEILKRNIFDIFTAEIKNQLELKGLPTTREVVENVRLQILRTHATMQDICVLHAMQLALQDPNTVKLHVGSLAFKTLDRQWDIEYGEDGVGVVGGSAR